MLRTTVEVGKRIDKDIRAEPDRASPRSGCPVSVKEVLLLAMLEQFVAECKRCSRLSPANGPRL